jgi:hypothetical protein
MCSSWSARASGDVKPWRAGSAAARRTDLGRAGAAGRAATSRDFIILHCCLLMYTFSTKRAISHPVKNEVGRIIFAHLLQFEPTDRLALAERLLQPAGCNHASPAPHR